MKNVFLILISFSLNLFSFDLYLDRYNYNSYLYELDTNILNKHEHITNNYDIPFNFKIDFKYKYLETNNVSYINNFIENKKGIDEPYDFEITGFYFSFKTIF